MTTQTVVTAAQAKSKEEATPDFRHILPPNTDKVVQSWLEEDIPAFDVAGVVVGSKPEKAVLLCKSSGVLCGKPFFDLIFNQLGCQVEWKKEEGDFLSPQPVMEVAWVTGPANKLLQGERTALNMLTRASGVATYARELKTEVTAFGWQGEVAGTRKTTPGFRLVEKYSLLVGGISTHRYNLSSMVMLKDNHIWASGSVAKAVKRARLAGGFSIKIEVECRSVEEAREAAIAGAEIVMLDNFEPMALEKASAILKKEFPTLTIEASGGIRRDTLRQYCLPTVDVVSMSRTTQGYSCVNFSLKLCKEGHDPRNPKVTVENI